MWSVQASPQDRGVTGILFSDPDEQKIGAPVRKCKRNRHVEVNVAEYIASTEVMLHLLQNWLSNNILEHLSDTIKSKY